MAKVRTIEWPGGEFVYLIFLPDDATDSPLSEQNKLIIALDDEIQRLKGLKND